MFVTLSEDEIRQALLKAVEEKTLGALDSGGIDSCYLDVQTTNMTVEFVDNVPEVKFHADFVCLPKEAKP